MIHKFWPANAAPIEVAIRRSETNALIEEIRGGYKI
jgi:hypothetical protein